MQRHKFSAGLVGLALTLAACTDSSSDSASATTAAVATTGAIATTSAPAATDPTATSNPNYPDGLRGVRYCEVLLVHPGEGGIIADVWNTMGHSDCPQADWEQLDAAAIATERGVPIALLNGPRYWTLDSIQATMQHTAPVSSFGTIEMFLAATVVLGATVPDQTPYVAHGVNRDTVFVFDAGSEIYELTDTDGVHYVMQSYSQQTDPMMDASRLATLGDTLNLPKGWTYSVITLDDELDVYDTDGVAFVLQDELHNSYQRLDPPQV
jgi:hypothetical protein